MTYLQQRFMAFNGKSKNVQNDILWLVFSGI